MNTNKSWSSIGEEIRGAVEDALKTGDFTELGSAVSNTVRDVSDKVGQAVSGGKGTTHNYTEQWENATRERKRTQRERERQEQERAAAALRVQAPFVRKGRISGILYQVFGGIGTGVMAILTAVFGGLAIGVGGGFRVAAGIFAALLLGFIAMTRAGCGKRAQLRRAEKYLELTGHNHYMNIEDLALHTGKTKKYVLKDVKKQLEEGFFPEGHLDRQETCLMLDDKIYREYLSIEKQKRVQGREQKSTPQKAAPKAEPATADSGLDAMIAEGQSCIKRLREMNDNIPGEEISAKLFRLENLLKEIFDGLREHPEQMPQMQKFMSYYLPTTLKLVAAYEEFDDLSAQSEEIVEAKTEIEKTLDTINDAFEELLNRMFLSTAYDVTADAQVLQTMLAREGLTRQKEFEAVRK